MATRITAAGESLIARLQAEGRALVIDKFMFAHVAGQNPVDPIAPGATAPWEDLALEYEIPTEYRAFVNPNQVVYSALLGSDVGDFVFNWQGLFCTEHDTLVAVSTFPPVEKRKTDTSAGVSGNNITRNFILEFTGAKAATGIEVDASTWQLDFSVRLAGIDERERLSNRDIYGRAGFLGEGWRLLQEGGEYRFKPGTGYVEGIRIALDAPLLLPAPQIPCSVWLDVAHEPSGSDIAAVVRPMSSGPDEVLADYTTGAPFHTPHYLEKVAEIDAEGNVIDSRAACAVTTKSDLAAHAALIVNSEDAGHLPAFGSAPQNAAPILNAAGTVAWQVGVTPVYLNRAFDFHAYYAENFYGVVSAKAPGVWANSPPCRRADGTLYGGFFTVQSESYGSAVLKYTIWESGPYHGVEYVCTKQSNIGWSDWRHNGWQPDYSRVVYHTVPTMSAPHVMQYNGYVFIDGLVQANAVLNQWCMPHLLINGNIWIGTAGFTVLNSPYRHEQRFFFFAPAGSKVYPARNAVPAAVQITMFQTLPCLGE